MFPNADNAIVVRTDFDNQAAWNQVVKLIRAPVELAGEAFYAHVDLMDDARYRNVSTAEVIALVPAEYKFSFLFIVDQRTLSSNDFVVLVVDLNGSDHQSFRAGPSDIQGIENNLSIANMDFAEFANAVDENGTFRGFGAS